MRNTSFEAACLFISGTNFITKARSVRVMTKTKTSSTRNMKTKFNILDLVLMIPAVAALVYGIVDFIR